MIDIKDKKTMPLIPSKLKVGRPSTGSSLTPAERKRAQRLRDREAVVNENLDNATVTALCEQLQKKVSMGDVDLVKSITVELLKRTKLVFASSVTVTKKASPSKPGLKPKVTVTKKTPVKLAPKPKSKVTVTKKTPAKAPVKRKVTVTQKNLNLAL